MVAAIANKYGYKSLNVHKSEEDGPIDTGSDWVLVSKNEDNVVNQLTNAPSVASSLLRPLLSMAAPSLKLGPVTISFGGSSSSGSSTRIATQPGAVRLTQRHSSHCSIGAP